MFYKVLDYYKNHKTILKFFKTIILLYFKGVNKINLYRAFIILYL